MILPNIAAIGQRDPNTNKFLPGNTPWNKGRHLSDETKAKISAALKGTKRPDLVAYNKSLEKRQLVSKRMSGKNHPNYGKHCPDSVKAKLSKANGGSIVTDEVRDKIRRWHLGRPLLKSTREKLSKINKGKHLGAKNPNWRGGKSFEPYSATFNKRLKAKIRKRDHYTCQECGHTEEELGYTLNVHHIDYDKKNVAPDNLISLCKSCHAQTNFDREDWKDYFKTKLCQ